MDTSFFFRGNSIPAKNASIRGGDSRLDCLAAGGGGGGGGAGEVPPSFVTDSLVSIFGPD